MPHQTNEELALIKDQLTKTLGDSGTSRYGGYFQEEPNAKWRDDARITIVEEMRRSDGAVKAVLNAIKAPILSTEWRVETTDDSPRGQEIRDFVDNNIFHLERDWKEFVREAFAYLDFGHYVFELIYKIDGGKIILQDLEPRIPSSILNWQTKDKRRGIQQLIKTDEASEKPSIVDIPEEKLLILTNDKEGDDVTGQSVLRPAYKHYKFKDVLYRISGISAERYGVGIPVATLPEAYGQAEKDAIEQQVKEMRSNERSYLVLPSGYKLEIITPSGNPMGQQIKELIEHHNKMILTSTLSQFLGLGSDGSGSLALSKDMSSFFLKHVEDKAHYFAGQISKQVIRRLVRLNYGDQETYPELRFTPLGDIDFKEMSEVVNTLVTAGLVKPEPKLQQWTRQTFKLPELSDEEVVELEKTYVEDEEVNREMKKRSLENPQPVEEKKPKGKEEKKKLNEWSKNFCLLEERTFSLPRKLTEQEERVGYEKLNEEYNEIESDIEDELAEITAQEIERFANQVKKKIDAGDIAAIALLTLLLLGRARTAIGNAIKRSYEIGKKGMSKELGVSLPTTSKRDSQIMALDIEDHARTYVQELERKAKGLAKDAIAADASSSAIASKITQDIKEDAAVMITNISGTVTGKYVNRGRARVAVDNLTMVIAFQRSEVLDLRTCPMCLSIDGRVVKPDDPIASMDIVHSHCRGLWTPIIAADVEQPKVTGLPKTILENFDLIDGRPRSNAFTQLKKPLNKSNKEVQAIIRKKME